MKTRFLSLKPILVVVLSLIATVVLFVVFSVLYTYFSLAVGRSRGVYDTPQAAIYARAAEGYTPDARVVIERAVPNRHDGGLQHHWYVIWKIYATAHKDGTPLYYDGYDTGGSNFVQTRDGWIFLSEAQMPGYVAQWMEILNLAGDRPAEEVRSSNTWR